MDSPSLSFLLTFIVIVLYLFYPLFADPATCPIVPGQETVIEISKGRSGLGLSIVGGKDTQLVWDSTALFLPN